MFNLSQIEKVENKQGDKNEYEEPKIVIKNFH